MRVTSERSSLGVAANEGLAKMALGGGSCGAGANAVFWPAFAGATIAAINTTPHTFTILTSHMLGKLAIHVSAGYGPAGNL